MTKTETNNKDAAVAAQGAQVASNKTSAKKGASQKKAAPKAKNDPKSAATNKAAKPGKEAKATKKAANLPTTKEASAPRAESKGAKILQLIARDGGATLAEIMKATDWQAHSVRGFLSTAGKKRGLKIDSTKNDDGARTYTIKG